MTSTQKAVGGVIAALLVLFGVVYLVAGGLSDEAADGPGPETTESVDEAAITTTTTAPVEATAPTTILDPADDPVDPGSGSGPSGVMTAMADLPLDIAISDTSGLSDGDTVTIRVTPENGSKIFGADARVCRQDASIDNVADYAPTQGGQCTAGKLSANADPFKEFAGEEPYDSLEIQYRVGVGTSSYEMQDGTPVSIACGPGRPCTLVVRYQVPDGFGFQTYRLSYD